MDDFDDSAFAGSTHDRYETEGRQMGHPLHNKSEGVARHQLPLPQRLRTMAEFSLLGRHDPLPGVFYPAILIL